MITLEMITHYQCEQCNGRWSSKDAFLRRSPFIFCSHCGHRHKHADIEKEMEHEFRQLIDNASFYYEGVKQ